MGRVLYGDGGVGVAGVEFTEDGDIGEFGGVDVVSEIGKGGFVWMICVEENGT